MVCVTQGLEESSIGVVIALLVFTYMQRFHLWHKVSSSSTCTHLQGLVGRQCSALEIPELEVENKGSVVDLKLEIRLRAP